MCPAEKEMPVSKVHVAYSSLPVYGSLHLDGALEIRVSAVGAKRVGHTGG